MENLQLSIKIENIEQSFVWESKKFPLLSFIGFVLNNAALHSSKELSSPLKANINGKVYTFRDKQINVQYESLPKLDKIAFNGNLKEALKLNFVGFVLNTLLGEANENIFKTLNFSKDKAIQAAATKEAKSIIELAKVSLIRYKEAKAFIVMENKKVRAICAEYGIGVNTEKYKELAKQYDQKYIAAIAAPKVTAAAAANEKTRQKRSSSKKEAAAQTETK